MSVERSLPASSPTVYIPADNQKMKARRHRLAGGFQRAESGNGRCGRIRERIRSSLQEMTKVGFEAVCEKPAELGRLENLIL